MRIAIIGGGIAGLTAAYELARLARSGAPVEAVLFESSPRLGGLIETVREGGFTVEAGPDGWVSAKPWARELAIELGAALGQGGRDRRDAPVGADEQASATCAFKPIDELAAEDL